MKKKTGKYSGVGFGCIEFNYMSQYLSCRKVQTRDVQPCNKICHIALDNTQLPSTGLRSIDTPQWMSAKMHQLVFCFPFLFLAIQPHAHNAGKYHVPILHVCTSSSRQVSSFAFGEDQFLRWWPFGMVEGKHINFVHSLHVTYQLGMHSSAGIIWFINT